MSNQSYAALSEPNAEAATLKKWPHLARPGPQACNRVASSFEEQYASIFRPRPIEPPPRSEAEKMAAAVRAYPELFRETFLELLSEPIAEILADVQAAEAEGKVDP
jgi:hypothetical protein